MALEGRRVLFISYNGMHEPLGQTQVIPYVSALAKKGVHVTLLSFEKVAAFLPEATERGVQLKQKLAAQGIDWYWLRYHQRPSVPATVYDVIAGISYADRLVRKNNIELVHARGHIPATIALALKKRRKVKMIFDLRGLMAEEYVDAQHWREGGLPYRLTKATERRILAAADAIVTLTERIWPIIQNWFGLKGRSVHHAVIPCCVDLSVFKYSEADRLRRRAELGLGSQLTLVYSGSLDGWYLTEKMTDFFASFLRHHSDAHLLWLTTGAPERVRGLMSERGIETSSFSVRSVSALTVPSYLSAADAGLSFIKPCFSKIASSPTKNGEYLACGLPLIINAGVGDADALVDQWKVGVLIKQFDEEHYDQAINEISRLLRDPDIRAKTRAVAKELLDLQTIGAERYAALYERVLD
ncbi:MAG TPA: glycosyltransferase [Pyrinomonadaceae bacterium]|jgi:glycosyltransferase involved in cell wall biosynthesis|nr:glycosyltransferase [Pyrinomonadaceae bacterium]